MSTRYLKALRLSVSLLFVGGLVASVSRGGGVARAEVTLVQVEQGTVTESVSAAGTLGARRSWPVVGSAAGTIQEILVANGQQVNKGDVIVRLASEAIDTAAEQAAALHKSALVQKQMFDASMSGGGSAALSGAPLATMAASLVEGVGGLDQATTRVVTQAHQLDLPSVVHEQLNALGSDNVMGFLQTLLERRTEIQRLAGDLSKSAAGVKQLVQSLVTTLDALDSGDAQAIVPSVMRLATEAGTGLTDMVTLATTLQAMMDLLTLPPEAAGEMPADLVGSVIELLGDGRGAMTGPLADLGANLDKAQKSLVQVVGMTVANLQSSLETAATAGAGGMSLALGAYVEATSSMMRSAAEKKAALEVRAPEAGIVALGTISAAGAAAPDASSLLGSALGGGSENVGGVISSALGGLTGGGEAASPQPLISVGSEVGWGQKLFTVYDTAGWSARVTVDEAKISRLTPGMPAVVGVTSLGKSFPATLSWISPVGNSSGGSVTFALEAALDVPPEEAVNLRIGTKANVAITLAQVGPAPVVKLGALSRDGASVTAFVVRQGKTIAREVKVLASDGVNAAVEGLEDGDQVVLAPIDIKDGQAVKVVG